MYVRCGMFIAATLGVHLASGQSEPGENGPDEIRDFCSVSGTSLAIAQDTAYIFGGWSIWEGFSNYTAPNNYLRTIDLSRPFRVGADVSQYVERDELPTIVPRGTYTDLWPINNNTINMFLGFHEVSDADVELDTFRTKVQPLDAKFQYHINNKTWTQGRVKKVDFEMMNIKKDKDNAIQKPVSRMSAWVPSLKRGYSLGGTAYLDSPNFSYRHPREFDDHRGFLRYDAKKDSWTNLTMPEWMPEIRQGVLVHLSTADDELIITFGGNAAPKMTGNRKYLSMREFGIYSIKQSRWYHYVAPTVRAVPNPRVDLCWAIVSAQDNSSHQIIISGGEEQSGDVANPEDSVWALSIPTFDWIQLSGNSNDSTRKPGPRIDPVCTVIGNKYMLSYGGRRIKPNSSDVDCDVDGNNVFLLDMNTGGWIDEFVPGQKYLVPREVVDVIGGSGKGGATKTGPDGGFGDTDLEALMTFDIVRPVTPSASPSPQSASGPSTPSRTKNIGAIAGGAVGGVVALVVLGFGLFYFNCWNRKNKQPESIEVGELHSMATPWYEVEGSNLYSLKYQQPPTHGELPGSLSPPVYGELHGDSIRKYVNDDPGRGGK